MTIKNIVIRKKLEGTSTEILYPVTSIENVTGLSSLLTTINTNLDRIENEINEAIEKADATYIGETEPSETQYKTWLKLEPKEPEIETNMVIDNEIETEPMLDEIESGELTGDEIITPPQFE